MVRKTEIQLSALLSQQTTTDMSAFPLYLQKFVDSGDLIDKNTSGCDEQTMIRYKNILKTYVPETHLRGMDDE